MEARGFWTAELLEVLGRGNYGSQCRMHAKYSVGASLERGMSAGIMEARELWKRGNFGARGFWKSWGAGIMEVIVECMQNAVSGHVWSAE